LGLNHPPGNSGVAAFVPIIWRQRRHPLRDGARLLAQLLDAKPRDIEGRHERASIGAAARQIRPHRNPGLLRSEIGASRGSFTNITAPSTRIGLDCLWDARRSLLCHARFAQPYKIRRFEQDADLRYPKRFDGPQTGNARITIIAAQVPGRGEFCDGLPDLACEAIG